MKSYKYLLIALALPALNATAADDAGITIDVIKAGETPDAFVRRLSLPDHSNLIEATFDASLNAKLAATLSASSEVSDELSGVATSNIMDAISIGEAGDVPDDVIDVLKDGLPLPGLGGDIASVTDITSSAREAASTSALPDMVTDSPQEIVDITEDMPQTDMASVVEDSATATDAATNASDTVTGNLAETPEVPDASDDATEEVETDLDSTTRGDLIENAAAERNLIDDIPLDDPHIAPGDLP